MTSTLPSRRVQRTPAAWLTRDSALLPCGRALRSLSLGYLTVLVPVDLASDGYSATKVGLVFTAGAIGSMILTAGVGLLADRIGRKPILITLGILSSTAALTFALSECFWIRLVAAALGTIGRGGGAGSSGACAFQKNWRSSRTVMTADE